MNFRKIFIAILITIVTIPLVIFLWKSDFFLILAILILVMVKHRLFPSAREGLVFLISGVVGSLAESAMMLGGGWSYQSPRVLNFPLYLPFLWGLVGVVGISLYEGLTGR